MSAPQDSLSLIRHLVSNGVGLVSLLYRSKTDGSLARYTVNLGFKYSNLLEKSKKELETNIELGEYTGENLIAANEVLASFNKSIEAHNNGTQSDDYTKKGQYTPLGNGVNLNEDNSIQLFGLIVSKVVIEPGTPKKPVKSKPMTILKNAIKKELPVSKFREFALDLGNIQTVKMNGETLEIA